MLPTRCWTRLVVLDLNARFDEGAEIHRFRGAPADLGVWVEAGEHQLAINSIHPTVDSVYAFPDGLFRGELIQPFSDLIYSTLQFGQVFHLQSSSAAQALLRVAALNSG